MKRQHVAALVAAVVIGALVYFGLDRRKPPEPRIPSAGSAKAPQAGRGNRGGGSDAPDAEAPLVEDDPRGTLRLEGQVVAGPDSHAVAGAVVTIDAHPLRTATTDASGGFAFDALVGRPYTLVAHAPAGVAGPVTAKLTASSDPVVLHLRAAATLAVTVTGPGGAPISGATVELRGQDEQRAITAGDGLATFASVIPATYQLAGWGDGLAHAYQRVRVGAGANQAHLVLVRGASVTGKVVDEHGAAVAGARVTAGAVGEFAGFGARRRDAVTSGSDGAFRFDALPAGTMRFEGSHPSYAPGVSAPVTLDGVHEHTGVVLTMSDGATVSGRVVDAAHQPVVAARVRVGVVASGAGPGGIVSGAGDRRARGAVGGGPTGNGGPPREGYTGPDGTFAIHGLPKRDLVAIALHETGASRDVAVDASRGDVSGVELVLDVTGTISGLVVDPTGSPIEGAQVSARPSFDAAGSGSDAGPTGFAAFRLRGMPQELTDGAGKFTLTGLAPGAYELTASRSRSTGRARRNSDGVTAKVGDKDVKIVLQPEGGVTGTVVMAGGATPSLFTVQVGPAQQSFPGGGAFELDDLVPGTYQLEVRGPEFQTKTLPVNVAPGQIADVGAIAVAPGRTLSGIVVANGRPVANADVYGGHMLLATGTANAAAPIASQFNATVKQTQSGSDGTFALSGFDDGDLSIVAERSDLGRSAPQRVAAESGTQPAMTLTIIPYGTLSGVVRQGGAPAEGIIVTCQSVSTPGVIYTAPSGADGSYRFDQIAADTYKVSATLRVERRGMQFYSQQVTVAPGASATVDLAADGGTITLELTAVPKSGTLTGGMAWLASAQLAATNERDLGLAIAALGASTSQLRFLRGSQPVAYTDCAPGAYTICVVPFPTGLRGQSASQYIAQHGAQMPAVCQPVTVAASPASQSVSVSVDVPPMAGAGSAGSAN